MRAWLFLPVLCAALFCPGEGLVARGEPVALKGRVEALGSSAEPRLPGDILQGGADAEFRPGLRAGVSQEGSLPQALRGEWDGTVRITQLQTFPELHDESYCRRFIAEIDRTFKLGKSGQIVLKFQAQPTGALSVASSNVYFARGLRIQLANTAGPSLVPGSTTIPTPVKNQVSQLGEKSVEQVRVDYVRLVDADRRLVHSGFTEVSASYEILSEKRMRLKIVNIDYDESGRPLWKTLMEGEARRWSSR